jgi:hypothetical protein
MYLPPANGRIWANSPLYATVYRRYSVKFIQICMSILVGRKTAETWRRSILIRLWRIWNGRVAQNLSRESVHFGLQNDRHSVCALRNIIAFNHHICAQMDQCRSQNDNWGGRHIFIYSCSALLISFEINCFYGM